MSANQAPLDKPNGQGFRRIFKATYCSILGFKAAFKHEAAFRQELLLFVLLSPLAWFISESLMDFVSLIVVMILVLIVELLNSAIEAVVDRVGLERHELSGRAKDLGSAAVTLSLVIAGIVWIAHIIK
ncbi:diacylglycerol kinase [Psychrosphaera haliotis]|uniref:diacylglycerol kinase n=1 Tax=Psychrosphaera haliotis TaxID=555083 RepID=UPI0031DDAAEA